MAATDTSPSLPASRKKLSLPEFVSMLAVLFATVAFSIDAMLPSLPQIAAELSPENSNRAQLVLIFFVAGMGVGTAAAGPISDAIGRKRTIILGSTIYVASAAAALFADSLTLLLILRFFQGMGASGPRIAGTAMVRDIYSGREMARITSFVMMVFIMIPAFAPILGEFIVDISGSWRSIFVAFIVFGVTGAAWVTIRQPETLPPERRVPLNRKTLTASVREILSNRQVMLCTLVLTLGFGQMFALLTSSEQVFSGVYGRGENYAKWFALMALLSSIGTFINVHYVLRYGMRKIARAAYAMQIIAALLALCLVASGALTGNAAFYGFFIWAVSLFCMAGVTFGNLNALALQNMPHLAGLTASVVAALSSIGAVLIAAPVGQAFNGTPTPLMLAALICSALAWLFMRRLSD